MKRVKVTSAEDFDVGDFVMLKNKSCYGRIVKIEQATVEENDHYAKYGTHKPGDILNTKFTVEKVLDSEMDRTKKYKSTAWSWEIKKIDKEFIKDMFRKLNDELAKSRMLKERGEF